MAVLFPGSRDGIPEDGAVFLRDLQGNERGMIVLGTRPARKRAGAATTEDRNELLRAAERKAKTGIVRAARKAQVDAPPEQCASSLPAGVSDGASPQGGEVWRRTRVTEKPAPAARAIPDTARPPRALPRLPHLPRLRLPRGRTRIVVTAFCWVVLQLVVLEGAAWAGYAAWTGKAFSYAAADRERLAVAAALDGGDGAEDASPGSGEMVMHPFLGYTLSGDPPPAVIAGARPDVVTVGVFGGSVASRFAEGGRDELRRMLEQDPRLRGKTLEIFRAASDGYKQPQQLLALNYYLSMGQHFDMIVNIDGFNEVALAPVFNVPKGVNPFFPSNWQYVARKLPDMRDLALIGRITDRRADRSAWAATFSSGVLRGSIAAQLVWKITDDRAASSLAGMETVLATQPTPAENGAPLGPAADYADDARLLADLVAQWEHSSEMMAELAQANGIPYLHFLQPNQYVPRSKALTQDERRYAYMQDSKYRTWVERGYPLLQEGGKRLQAKGIAFRDLSGLFRGTRGTVYEDNCCHLNGDGNALLGDAVAAAIREEPLRALAGAEVARR